MVGRHVAGQQNIRQPGIFETPKRRSSFRQKRPFKGESGDLSGALVNAALEIAEHVTAGPHAEGDDGHRGGLVRRQREDAGVA